MSWVRHIIALANMDILEMEKSALVILGLFNYTLSISFGWDVTPLYLLVRQITISKPHNTRSLPLKFCVSYCFKNAFKNVHSSGEHLNQSINQSIKILSQNLGVGGGGRICRVELKNREWVMICMKRSHISF